jgi:RHS repeat-associated protein
MAFQTTTPQVSYLTQDHLGSPRIITDNVGKVIARKDFNAFGDETYTSQRTEQLGYKPEEIRQDYTGYQKDDESRLEFAQARYYNTKHGRFTSVDPLTASANVKDPQTFNLYSYAMNSPYKFTDPLGLKPCVTDATAGGCNNDDDGFNRGIGDETRRAEADFDQRLENTYDIAKANKAIARGDQATARAICDSNATVKCSPPCLRCPMIRSLSNGRRFDAIISTSFVNRGLP